MKKYTITAVIFAAFLSIFANAYALDPSITDEERPLIEASIMKDNGSISIPGATEDVLNDPEVQALMNQIQTTMFEILTSADVLEHYVPYWRATQKYDPKWVNIAAFLYMLDLQRKPYPPLSDEVEAITLEEGYQELYFTIANWQEIGGKIVLEKFKAKNVGQLLTDLNKLLATKFK